jgi:hypothetical protein
MTIMTWASIEEQLKALGITSVAGRAPPLPIMPPAPAPADTSPMESATATAPRPKTWDRMSRWMLHTRAPHRKLVRPSSRRARHRV